MEFRINSNSDPQNTSTAPCSIKMLSFIHNEYFQNTLLSLSSGKTRCNKGNPQQQVHNLIFRVLINIIPTACIIGSVTTVHLLSLQVSGNENCIKLGLLTGTHCSGSRHCHYLLLPSAGRLGNITIY